jgi:lysophospholipase L1-like esterase
MARLYTLDPAMAFENGATATETTVGDVTYYKVGNGARWKWTTSARKLILSAYAEYGSDSNNGRIGMVVDGAPYFYGTPRTTGVFQTTLWLPRGADKVVELFVPLQYAASAGGARLGVYPYHVAFDAEATEITPSLPANHLVIYGDSIASGGIALCPSVFGYAGLMKWDTVGGKYDGAVTQVSWGTRRLADDCATSGAATAFVTALLALNPTKILLAIGSNDHSVIPAVSLVNFTTYYERLLDEIHAQDDTIPIVCLSPIRRGAEGTNANGNTMAEFRTAISNAVSARSGWSVPPSYEDGLAIFADLTQLPDGIHPGTTGNDTMRDAVLLAV